MRFEKGAAVSSRRLTDRRPGGFVRLKAYKELAGIATLRTLN